MRFVINGPQWYDGDLNTKKGKKKTRYSGVVALLLPSQTGSEIYMKKKWKKKQRTPTPATPFPVRATKKNIVHSRALFESRLAQRRLQNGKRKKKKELKGNHNVTGGGGSVRT